MAEAAGCGIGVLRATGGSANSLLWTQIKADITGKDFIVPYSDMATVLGTALLTGVGVGMYKDFEEAVSLTIKEERIHKADPGRWDIYDKNYQVYKSLYRDLKDLMGR